MKFNVRDIIDHNYVKFSLYKNCIFYYDITLDNGKTYTFSIPVSNGLELTRVQKASTVKIYIQHAIDNGSFVEKKGV